MRNRNKGVWTGLSRPFPINIFAGNHKIGNEGAHTANILQRACHLIWMAWACTYSGWFASTFTSWTDRSHIALVESTVCFRRQNWGIVEKHIVLSDWTTASLRPKQSADILCIRMQICHYVFRLTCTLTLLPMMGDHCMNCLAFIWGWPSKENQLQ